MPNAYAPTRRPIRIAAFAVSATLVAAGVMMLNRASEQNDRFAPLAKAAPASPGKVYARSTGWHDSLRVAGRFIGLR
jgi:hypothetical protein